MRWSFLMSFRYAARIVDFLKELRGVDSQDVQKEALRVLYI